MFKKPKSVVDGYEYNTLTAVLLTVQSRSTTMVGVTSSTGVVITPSDTRTTIREYLSNKAIWLGMMDGIEAIISILARAVPLCKDATKGQEKNRTKRT